jgi:hypothetical protein
LAQRRAAAGGVHPLVRLGQLQERRARNALLVGVSCS